MNNFTGIELVRRLNNQLTNLQSRRKEGHGFHIQHLIIVDM